MAFIQKRDPEFTGGSCGYVRHGWPGGTAGSHWRARSRVWRYVFALAPAASAQEAPQCLKAAEKLSDKSERWRGTNGKDSVTGLRGKDKLDGRDGNDFINGGRDNDVVKGGAGKDLLCGGRGTDKIIGGPGNDTIFGEEENDTILPGPGNDKVLGSAGDDKIFGWAEVGGEIVDDGHDVLNGGFNDDVIEAGGDDELLGHTHNDLLSTRTPLIAPAVMDGGGNDDTIHGSDADDVITGGENGSDTLYGAGGNDTLRGEGNDDKLFGQGGDDDLFGGDGVDELSGGDGNDTLRRRRARRQGGRHLRAGDEHPAAVPQRLRAAALGQSPVSTGRPWRCHVPTPPSATCTTSSNPSRLSREAARPLRLPPEQTAAIGASRGKLAEAAEQVAVGDVDRAGDVGRARTRRCRGRRGPAIARPLVDALGEDRSGRSARSGRRGGPPSARRSSRRRGSRGRGGRPRPSSSAASSS